MTGAEGRIGFVGLGAMGMPMAVNLVEAGHDVVVWTRDAAKLRDFGERTGARIAAGPEDLAAQSSVVLSCLLNTAVIESVYFGSGGLIAGARPGTQFVEHGTYAPSMAERVCESAASRGAGFIDAPVTGGESSAIAGTLVAMAGGPIDQIDRVRPVLESYCSRVFATGAVGSGLRLKLINQMLVTSHVAAAAEAVSLIRSSGLEPGAATEVLTAGWAGSTMLERILPLTLPAQTTDATSAPLSGLGEAQSLLADAAASAEIELPVFQAARRRFDDAVRKGWGERDLAWLAELSGSDDVV